MLSTPRTAPSDLAVRMAAPITSNRVVKYWLEVTDAGKPLRGEELGGRE
jgi:hypothetical protein